MFSGQRLRSVAHVLAPLWSPLHALEDVQHGRVVLAVVLVEGWSAVVGEDVVDVAASLCDVGLASVVPALHEEVLDVVVGDVVPYFLFAKYFPNSEILKFSKLKNYKNFKNNFVETQKF